MGRKKTDPKAKRRTEICERFGYYHDHLFHGQTREMARSLSVTHSVISKVRRGLQGPGEQLLAALTAHEQVNSRWLLEGEGEPILPPTAGTLPIAIDILPGPPALHPDLVTGDRHPASFKQERDSRYWLRLHDTHPLVHAPQLCMLPNDLLLLEAAPGHLTKLDLIDGRLCAIVLPQGTTHRFAFAMTFLVGDRVSATLIDNALPEVAKSGTPRSGSRSTTKRGRLRDSYGQIVPSRRRAISRRSKARSTEQDEMEGSNELAGRAEETGQTGQPSTKTGLALQPLELSSPEQIVGLVIALERPCISFRR